MRRKRAAVGLVGLGEDGREIQPLGLPVLDGLVEAEPLDAADHVLELAEAQFGHDAADVLGHEGQEADDILGLAVEPLPQIGVLRGDAHRAGAEVALPHQDAAQRDQGRRAEAEPLGAQQGADHHVAAGPHLAVALHEDAVAEAVQDQRLLGLGQADLPGRAGMLDRRQRAGPGAAVVAADQHFVGIALGHARRHRAHADFGDELHGDHAAGVGALQVVDQLGQVFDGIDVVVRRRRDQRHAGRGVPQPRDLVGHLVAGKLAAFARLGALGHLDLQDPGVGQVLDRHAEAAAGHLLDAAIERIAVGQGLVAGRVLAAFARVGVAAQPVHGDGQRLVGLAADRAVRHGAGVEPLDDLAGRLDFIQRHRLAGHELEHAAERAELLGLLVDRLGKLVEQPRIVLQHRVLQGGDGRRVPEVPLAVEAELILAAVIEIQQPRLPPAEARAVPGQGLAGDDVQVGPADPRGRAAGSTCSTNSRFRPTASNCWAEW